MENQLKSYPLAEGTIIVSRGLGRRYYDITIGSVKRITSSYILYSGCKNKKGTTEIEEIEIAELFVTPDDKRDVDGKTVIKTRVDSFGWECERDFFDLIMFDVIEIYNVGVECIRQILEFFSDEYGINENYIRANNTKYYVKSKGSKCPRCSRLYFTGYSYCPYCGNKKLPALP